MKIVKRFIVWLFKKIGYSISRNNTRLDFVSWANDSKFENTYSIVKSFTMLDRDRLFMLWQFSEQAKLLNGVFAQVGVFRGGSAKLIAVSAKDGNKSFYLFDTFTGMPEVNKNIDLHKKGDFSNTSLIGVKELFKDFSNIKFCEGFFPETAMCAINEKFSFVYIDVDIYQSVLDSLIFFYPKMIDGGFIIFDDYMGKNTPGVKKAIDEFLIGKIEKPIITTIGQCVIIKN